MLKKIATILKENRRGWNQVYIEGFTSSTGKRKHNLNLSVRRSLAVKNALINFGISGRKIIANGYGEYQHLRGAKHDSAVQRRVTISFGKLRGNQGRKVVKSLNSLMKGRKIEKKFVNKSRDRK